MRQPRGYGYFVRRAPLGGRHLYWNSKRYSKHIAAAARTYFLLTLTLALSGCVQGLFYHPDHIQYDTPKRAGLRFEPVSFPSTDGTQLSGWFIPAAGISDPRNAKGTVIHFHGNAQNLSAHWRYVEWLPKRGFNLFVFDYRGYGTSGGSPDVKSVFEDSNSALNYIRSRPDVNPDKLVVIGQSLGGANAIAAVGSGNKAGVKAVVIEAAFYSYSSITSDKISWAGIFMNDTFSPDRYIADISPIPFLLLHGTADQIIPFHHAIKLFNKAGEPKRLFVIEGGRHVEAFSPRFGVAYMDLVSDFIEAALSTK